MVGLTGDPPCVLFSIEAKNGIAAFTGDHFEVPGPALASSVVGFDGENGNFTLEALLGAEDDNAGPSGPEDDPPFFSVSNGFGGALVPEGDQAAFMFPVGVLSSPGKPPLEVACIVLGSP